MLGVTPVNNNSQPSFGINWTKGTAKFLKRIAPRLVETDGGFKEARKAIRNLAKLGKRNDGITAKISNDGMIGAIFDSGIDYFISVKNDKLKHFVYGDMQSSICCSSSVPNCANVLKKFSDYISKPEFIVSSNKAIREEIASQKGLKIKDKFNIKMDDIKEKTEDFRDFWFDLFGGGYDIEDFIPYRILCSIFQSPADKINTKRLRKFIDKQLITNKN